MSRPGCRTPQCGGKVYCEGDLEQTTTRSHMRMIKTLQRIDCHIADHALPAPASEIGRIEPIVMRNDPTVIDLQQNGIKSVVWATGYRRRYDWLNVAVVGSDGELIQHGGVTPAPGLNVLGLQYLRRRRSHFINGCAHDAEKLRSWSRNT
jgi:putative flavoprotein involved in K+ transport